MAYKVCAVVRRSDGDLNECRGNVVGSQRQRNNSVMRYPKAPQGRHVHVVGRHMIAARTSLYVAAFPLWGVAVTLPRRYSASTAFALCLYRIWLIHCALTETTQSCHGDHCAPMAFPWSHSAFAGRWHSDRSALWSTICKRNVIQVTFIKIMTPIRNFRRWKIHFWTYVQKYLMPIRNKDLMKENISQSFMCVTFNTLLNILRTNVLVKSDASLPSRP